MAIVVIVANGDEQAAGGCQRRTGSLELQFPGKVDLATVVRDKSRGCGEWFLNRRWLEECDSQIRGDNLAEIFLCERAQGFIHDRANPSAMGDRRATAMLGRAVSANAQRLSLIVKMKPVDTIGACAAILACRAKVISNPVD